jgi:parallel beta-helix repeat protein
MMGNAMKKALLIALLTVVLLCDAAFVGTLRFGTVYASTDAAGIISSDTTWTKANSPYNLKGPVAVNNGVTLTVEAGVTVNLNGYYIQVNGTLVARGSSTDKINYLNGGSIVFTTISNSWNEQTCSGSIIENAVITGSIRIMGVSPKITRSSLDEIYVSEGSSTISYNTITGEITVAGGAPSISNNDITNATPGTLTVGAGGSPAISGNTINSRVIVKSGSPVISNNKIADGIHADSSYGQIVINNNEITVRNLFRAIYVQGIHAEISNNRITGNGDVGIHVFGSLSSASISNDIISDCTTGISVNAGGGATTIVRNLVFNNEIGISFEGNVTVRDNTITGNSVGIQCNPSQSSTITNNNIQGNSQHNFRSESANDIIATYNWWGTTDSSLINQTIYDNKYDFNLGKVDFTPFLTAPNPEAPAMPTQTPTPTPTTTSTPTQSPTSSPLPSQSPTASPATPQTGVFEIAIAVIIISVVINVLLVIVVALLLGKKR